MAGKFNLLDCSDICLKCVRSYKKKHDLASGGSFGITCGGIPKNYISPGMSSLISEEDQAMLSLLDPVKWAAQVLDWHCIDPDGEIWKRKTEDGTLGTVTPYIDEIHSELVKQGKSAFHRPYQLEALQCTSKRKVFRWGRQLGKSEVLVIAILFAVCTHRDFNVILVTPYQAQIDMIFKRLETMIRTNPAIANSIKRNVKAPNYQIELHNGSCIKGFTAGTKSGGNADAVRGQAAQMLVLDEMDYLGSGDIASVLSVITNYPNATVWMSSTPTGKHEKFYEICHSPLYKEIHHPSTINPLWDDSLEAFFRGELTSIQYDHEILALFGEQEQGVYQSSYINEAMEDYRYEDMSVNPEWVFAIGVDWNDIKIGTTICVTGYHPIQNEFRVFTREIVQRDGWSQHAAVQRIIELNQKWQPRSIYVDKGFGGVQHEILTKFGWDALSDKTRGKNHPDSRLRNIVKQYDFGSKVTIKDLHTREDIDKPSKSFLVENSVRRFEQKKIKFSKHDIQMEAELRGYIVDHITSTGVPVYKQGNEKVGDHNLDALNLSLVAFTLDMSAFGVVSYETRINFTGNIGDSVPQPNLLGQPGKPIVKANKPDLQRTAVFATTFMSKNPAHNTLLSGKRMWAWEGWERDAPRPVSNMKSMRRSGPPSRKKF